MAPFDPSLIESNVGAYIGVFSGLSALSILTFLVVQTLVRAHKSIPVAHRTRAHDAERRAGTFTFAALAVLSLAINLYTFQDMLVDSYRNWAFEHKQAFPVDVWTAPAWYPRPNSKDLQLARWLQNNDLSDCVKVMAGSWRDYWWQQQQATATAVWTVFLAVEGRRRNIPYTWVFLTIAHLLGLSVALNLFYLALLFTPTPLAVIQPSGRLSQIFEPVHGLSRKIFGDIRSRPHTLVPKPFVYLVPFALSLACTAMLPYGIGTPFQDFFLNAPQMLCYLTLLVTNTAILPTSFFTNQRTIHAAHASTTPVFRTATLLSLALHATSTALAVSSNIPPARRTLYGILFDGQGPFSNTAAGGTQTQRYSVAIARTLGALSDHPIVQKIGWDVLLCAVSICTWAGMRGLGPRPILSAAGVPLEVPASGSKGGAGSAGPSKHARKPSGTATVAGRSKSKAGASAAEATDEAVTGTAATTPRRAREHEDERSADAGVEGAEGAALAWGICVIGGLGVGMSSVGGAEAA